MKTLTVSMALLCLLLSLSFTYDVSFEAADWILGNGLTTDTISLSSNPESASSTPLGPQTALVAVAPSGSKLKSVRMYYTSKGTGTTSRVFVKSTRSNACGGPADQNLPDQYTLGESADIQVAVPGWQEYTFDPPIDITADTIYIWPNPIQLVHPRIAYATSSKFFGAVDSLMRLNGSLCANGTGTHPTDYACELTFIRSTPCADRIEVIDDFQNCYAADTLISKAMISNGKSIEYLSKDCVKLDTGFHINTSSTLVIDMDGCK